MPTGGERRCSTVRPLRCATSLCHVPLPHGCSPSPGRAREGPPCEAAPRAPFHWLAGGVATARTTNAGGPPPEKQKRDKGAPHTHTTRAGGRCPSSTPATTAPTLRERGGDAAWLGAHQIGEYYPLPTFSRARALRQPHTTPPPRSRRRVWAPPPALPPCVSAKEQSREEWRLCKHIPTRDEPAGGPSAHRKPTTHRPRLGDRRPWQQERNRAQDSRATTHAKSRCRRPQPHPVQRRPTAVSPTRPHPSREAPPFVAVTPAESRRRASPHLAVANPCTTGT